MNNFTLNLPTKVVFGKDVEKNVGALAKEFGATKVFIVYGSERVVKNGLLKTVEDSLAEAGIASIAMGGVVANPVLSTALKMIEKAKEFNADFILGVGGGSVIDTAKCVAHGAANPDVYVWDFWAGKAKLTKTLPIGTVCTIAAAGSEMSNSAVITDDINEPHYKKGINSELQRPRFATMNPELTMTLPKYQIAAGVVDIFMHTSERYFGDPECFQNHLTDEFAEGLFRTIIKYGKIGFDDPTNYEAMSEIMACGSMSHNGLTGLGMAARIGRDGDFAVHRLGMSISGVYNSTHGATLSAVWGAWARYVYAECPKRFVQFAQKVWDIKEDGEAAVEAGIRKMEEWFKSLDMPATVTELMGRELSDEEMRKLAVDCTFGGTATPGAFKVLNEDDCYQIYVNAK